MIGAKSRVDDEPGVDLLVLALWLGETPIGPLGYESPDDATRRLFGLPHLPRRAV